MGVVPDIALRCRCGAVRGSAQQVTPRTVNHCFCYCDDCQAFAHWLGRADDVLDAWGGTEIAQLSQARVAITLGLEHTSAVRLTPKGLVRWYASCCNTPIGNTLSSSAVPFVGLIRAFVDAPTTVLGPVRARSFAARAKGGRAALPKDGMPEIVMIARVLALMVGWRLRGDQKRSAFFPTATDRPFVVPRVLSALEREDLRLRCARWRGEPAAGD